MTYRDRPIRCPRCRIDIQRTDAKDRWRCAKCEGVLISVEEIIIELVRIAPDLAPAGRRAVDLTTLGRRSDAPLVPCGACGADMEPVFLGGVDVDRCYHDQLLWFDVGEHQRTLDRAQDQHARRHRSWLGRWLDGL